MNTEFNVEYLLEKDNKKQFSFFKDHPPNQKY